MQNLRRGHYELTANVLPVIASEWRSPNSCSASDAILAPHAVIGCGPNIQRNRPAQVTFDGNDDDPAWGTRPLAL